MNEKSLAPLALAVLLCGCASSPPPDDHRFVVLGPDGAAVARVITGNARCPDIDVDGMVRPMTVRMPPGTMPLRPTRSAPTDSKPSAFPVLTCEAPIPAGARNATVGDRILPLPKANPQRIVLIGDTGCRLKSGDGVFQDCDNPEKWPFERVAEAVAALAPDLVVHVGDYHYRENACPATQPGCAGSPWGYGWDAWEADLFRPARRLLQAAPWVVVRGNHESCNRAGQGWWRFMDPRPVAPRQNCNDAADDAIGDFSEPYAVPYGADQAARFIVFDSSRVGIAPLAPTDAMYQTYRAQFERAFAFATAKPNAFFIIHHPVLGFAANPGNPQAPFPGNRGLQSVLDPLYPSALFPADVQALFSGHNHVLQVVSFASGQPPQFVIGNGGDWLDPPLPAPFPPGLEPAPGAVVAELRAADRFGYMLMEHAGAGWRLRAIDVHGALLTECVLERRMAACTPIR